MSSGIAIPRTNKLTKTTAATISVNDEEWDYTGNEMWAVAGDSYFPCDKTEKVLPPGQYLVNYSEAKGIYFTKKQINLDDLLVLPDSKSEAVLKSIDNFWHREKEFRKYGFLWKRGIMLYGPAGSGKTSLLQQISQQLIDQGGISIYLTSPEFVAEGLRVLRTIEPKRPIVVMIEDIDTHCERGGRTESALLSLLDGELQVDNIVFIATTNYPDRLDKRLVNRPSRFDEIIKIGLPSDSARELYITSKVKRLLKEPEELHHWVSMTKGFTIAHLREIVVSVECLGNTFESTIKRLVKMNEQNLKSDNDDSGGIGFTASGVVEDY